jgi:hypothetical protein
MDSGQQIFWTFFITTMCGFILALGRQLYKSKCKEIEICCIKITRDVGGEEIIDQLQLQNISSQQHNDDVIFEAPMTV